MSRIKVSLALAFLSVLAMPALPTFAADKVVVAVPMAAEAHMNVVVGPSEYTPDYLAASDLDAGMQNIVNRFDLALSLGGLSKCDADDLTYRIDDTQEDIARLKQDSALNSAARGEVVPEMQAISAKLENCCTDKIISFQEFDARQGLALERISRSASSGKISHSQETKLREQLDCVASCGARLRDQDSVTRAELTELRNKQNAMEREITNERRVASRLRSTSPWY